MTTNRDKTIAVLGPRGRVGAAAVEAFLSAGWEVRGVVRPGADWNPPVGATRLEANALDVPALTAALRGCAVVFNGLNPPYTDWPTKAVPLAEAVVEAAVAAGVETHLFPANVYNYGSELPEACDRTTGFSAGTVRKARIRIDMEACFRASADRLQSFVLRAGDFYGQGRGSWMDLMVAKRLAKGVLTYPGPMHLKHAWAYLPDLAATFVAAAERRASLPRYQAALFEGHSFTGAELQSELSALMGRELRVAKVPWFWMRFMGWVMPLLREVCEMEYLWRRSHRLVDNEVARWIQPTPLREALTATLQDLGFSTSEAV